MLRSLRASAGLLAARFHFRKYHDDVIPFAGAVTSAQRALLIMPLHQGEFLPTVMIVDMLRRRFREENMTVVTTEHSLEVMRVLPRSQVVRIMRSDLNTFLLPKKDFLRRLQAQTFDVAVDLNLDFVLPSGYICRQTNARVRVGFAGKRSDTFYNLQVRLNPEQGRGEAYDRLARCLQMF